MNFNKHSKLAGKHAFLSASKYQWLRYDEEKVQQLYSNFLATSRGTELHDFAAKCINLKQQLPDIPRTLNMYVNDCIANGMTPEVTLYYSDNCFGTADAIVFDGFHLTIHDLKTGKHEACMDQLYIYAALFCLEYDVKPVDIDITCRIYQSDDVRTAKPTVSDIVPIIDKIISFDQLIQRINIEEG